MMRFGHGRTVVQETQALLAMTADEHLRAAATAQAEASAYADEPDTASGYEARAQTHLMWATALAVNGRVTGR